MLQFYPLQDKNVNVNWSVSDPLDGRLYIVLRSENGIDFKEVGTIRGTAASMYNFTDKQPITGISYYRLKAISMNNAELLSDIVKLNLSGSDQKFNIYPNPVSNNHFTVGLTNAISGEYKISILTNTGAEVYNKIISNTSSALKFDITLNGYFAKGIYLMKIISPDKFVRSQTLVIK